MFTPYVLRFAKDLTVQKVAWLLKGPDEATGLYSSALSMGMTQTKLVFGHKGTVSVCSKTGELISTLKARDDLLWRVIASDATQTVIGYAGSVNAKSAGLHFWGMDGELKEYVKIHYSVGSILTVSSDGRYVAFLEGSSQNTLWIYSIGDKVRRIARIKADWLGMAKACRFTSDSHELLVLSHVINDSMGWSLQIIKCDINGRKLSSLKLFDVGQIAGQGIASISPDGTRVAALYQPFGTTTGSLYVWETANGKLITEIPVTENMLGGSLVFNSNGRLLAAGAGYQTTIWNLENHKSATFMMTFTDVINGNFQRKLNAMSSQSISEEQKQEIYLELARSGLEWIIYTPDLYFDCSRYGGELLAVASDVSSASIDQLALKYNRPDIILDRLGIVDKTTVDHYRAIYEKRVARLGYSSIADSGALPSAEIISSKQDGKFIDLTFKLVSTSGDLKQYNVFVNDVPLFGAAGKSVTGQLAELTEHIELTSGRNKIEITCRNDGGMESFRAFTWADYGEPTKGNLFYLGFGVSNYKNPELNLKYAAQDAKDLATAFARMKPHYGKVSGKVFTDQEVTIDTLKRVKTMLKNTKVDDTFVLFIAGHGMYDRTDEGTYYFLPHEADPDNLKETAAPFELIEDLLQGIPPRNKLFLMDTCESGELEDDAVTQYLASAKARGFIPRSIRGLKAQSSDSTPVRTAKRTYLYDRDRFIYNDLMRRSGAVVFSSCRGGELSYESDEIKNGFFTQALLNALGAGKGDTDGDKILTTEELYKYVNSSVSGWSGNLQNPTIDRDNIFQKFGFPVGQ